MSCQNFEKLKETALWLREDVPDVICKSLNVSIDEIAELCPLDTGMTNHSFSFRCKGVKYIMRIPGEGTDELIDREQEAEVYKLIDKKGLCDPLVYINAENGYKISEFLENARVCNPLDDDDVRKSMRLLRKFHNMKLKAEHEFDLFERIDFYESLWNGAKSIYGDYTETRDNVKRLKKYIDSYKKEKVLTHIDAVPDNFLFQKKDGKEKIYLMDWEYAGMQDPHVDIAMFCVYAFYNKEQVDKLISFYFEEGCSYENRIKVYCYIACCGLLWSNWCEYKRQLGVEFGEYADIQYRFAKDYFDIVKKEIAL